MTAKKQAWQWCSKYIRLRDAIEHQKNHPEEPFGNVACCTCGAVTVWNKNTDAGHFISRGSGGMSGVYFDERNIHVQCKLCNGFFGGRSHEYEQFMVDRYGQSTVDMLRYLDKRQSYKNKVVQIGLMYKQMYAELIKSTGTV